MTTLDHLLENNRFWVGEFHDRGAHYRDSQKPVYFWIGCCDGPFGLAPRLGLEPGELFIHRNLGNLVCGLDANGLAALQYAVDVLKVRHIIVCGHSPCCGMLAALSDEPLGLTDHWVSEIVTLPRRHQLTREVPDDAGTLYALCAHNVHEQVGKLYHTTIVRGALRRGQPLIIHGWMYDGASGLFHALRSEARCVNQVEPRQAGVATPGSSQTSEGRAKANDATTA